MTKVVHPFAHRLGIIRDWKSRWFGLDKKYRDFLTGDLTVRKFLEKRLEYHYLAGIEIERNDKTLRVVVKTGRPGLVIGRSGEHLEKVRQELTAEMKKRKVWNPKVELKIDVEEVRTPETSAPLIAFAVKESIEKRMPFRRALKQMVEKVMANREVEGVRVRLSGRLNGADMSRTEELKQGRVPLQTFRADIDYATNKAHIPQGDIGIKVWIYRGEVFAANEKSNQSAPSPAPRSRR